MANFTLDYTGEEVNALLRQVAAGGSGGSGGGGTLYVNVSAESMNEDMSFSNVTADKTYSEIEEAFNNGMSVIVLMNGANMGAPHQTMVIPLTSRNTAFEGVQTQDDFQFLYQMNVQGTVVIIAVVAQEDGTWFGSMMM